MIELDHVTKRFGDMTAVKDLSLTIPSGELFCFLGPNGAGKTTTIKMLCGLLRPTQGEIRVAGMPMQKNAVAVRRVMGYIPDTPFLYERLTPPEYLEFTADLYGVPNGEAGREIEAAIEQFGLVEHRDALIKDLSHGLRQRLIYASTFLHKPQVLLVDEPFIGLDPHSIRMIKELLRAKVAAGMTILLTTHILALAEDLADRIGIIMKGELKALGTLEELQRKHATDARLEDVFMKITEE
jgi:ABC-2 type transport system ATP-binding protein